MKPTIEIFTKHLQGYGGPDGYYVTAVCDNKILEEVDCGSGYGQGLAAARLMTKWGKNWNEDKFNKILASAKLYTPICDHCGKPFKDAKNRDKGSSIGYPEKYFCGDCQEQVPIFRAQQEAERAEWELQKEKNRVLELEAAHQKIHEALAGAFHWRDNLYFKRFENGTVHVMKHNKNYYPQYKNCTELHESIHPELIIPENEWASIVCSVSAGGETSTRYEEARNFHGKDKP